MDSTSQLLVAALALKRGWIDPARFVAVTAAEAAQPPGELLVQRGWITQEQRHDLEREAHRQHPVADTPPALSVSADDARRAMAYLANAADDPPPQGRYVRTRLHNEGGMGEVWQARDGQMGRDVALKRLKAKHEADAHLRTRFLAEARITGQLEHPGIVPVYEVIEREGEAPSYVMRLVRGRTLTEAVREYHAKQAGNAVALRDLLQAFVAACNTLAYAHSRGVIHRDLKPANVVLGPFGEVVVLDWGLAKVLADRPAEEDPIRPVAEGELDATEPGVVGGTPAYLAPEQALGQAERIDRRTDVFGLGAVLYEILTDRPPYQGANKSEVFQQAQRGEVTPPRQAVRGVPVALDAACRKALAKEAGERYQTATELADEVKRWLADERVMAYREPVVERVRRWGRQNRGVVRAGVVLLVASVMGLATTLWAVNREKGKTVGALARAGENLKLAKRAVDECFNIAKDHTLFQQPQMEEARKLLLATTLPFYQEFQSIQPEELDSRREIGKQHWNVAHIEYQLSRYQRALDACGRAYAVQRQLVDDFPDQAELRDDLARTLNSLGANLNALDRYEAGLEKMKQARDLREQLASEYPDVAEHRHQLARVYRNVSMGLRALGRLEEARQQTEQGKLLGMKFAREHPERPAYQETFAWTCFELGALLNDLNQPRKALEQYEQSRSAFTRLVQDHPYDAKYQQALGFTHNHLGWLWKDLGSHDVAVKHYDQARVLRLRLVRNHPHLAQYRDELANTYNGLGLVLSERARYTEAQEYYERSRDLRVELLEQSPGKGQHRYELGWTLNNLGSLLAGRKKGAEAEEVFRQARDNWAKLVLDHPKPPTYRQGLAWTCNALGLLLSGMGKPDQGFPELEKAQTLRSQLVHEHPRRPEYQVDLAGSCCNVANWLRDQGRPNESLPIYARAIALLEPGLRYQGFPERVRSFLAETHYGRASALDQLKRHREAAPDWDRALELCRPHEKLAVRVRRTESLARAGDVRRATDEAVALGGDPRLPPPYCYKLAAIHALAAGSPSPRPEKPVEDNARAAVALLRRAAAAGFFRAKENVAHLKQDADFAALRNREDFQQFLADLTR